MSQALVQAWYQGHWALTLLRPLSLVYRVISTVRRWGYRQGYLRSERAALPVIVVGNITAGGTGKTPLTLAIVRYLQTQGYRPAIVSRGYGGKTVYPALVTAQSHASEVGDEPLLMAQLSGVPVVVAPKRMQAVQLIEQQQLANVIVCDDGLQHYALARDIEIAVIDGERGLGNGRLLPEGPLREPKSRLAEVDFIVVNGSTNRWPASYAMHLVPQGLTRVGEHAYLPPSPPASVHAVAGIGNPARFFATVNQLGFSSINHAFADHHPFIAQDLAFNDDLAIVMTAKDAIKCQHFSALNLWQLPVHAQLDPAFFQQLHQRLTECQIKLSHKHD
ncbi:tetraacyldisaccharide 4'-kinase [Agitococcus lubricus]|uniref:Tetraacyldisaccharide 4'-kinase n=1 Tax=Agitococcus lubricus TaxID=1077255 RepID=A0A2T5J1S3_9GAMM|nr:tetraacyldisaccharide 4'-kinase [Agitococcus lubricus]PTQ90377.1 lipid-A-disaccharide kinase [Agitococcus lubricus]